MRAVSCAEQFGTTAFAPLTWRESLRDIEASLSADAPEPYAMGLRSAVKSSTLANANELLDWRIWSDMAAVLTPRAPWIYASDSLGVDLGKMVYGVGRTNIDLCQNLFKWVPPRSAKAADKVHTLQNLHKAIAAFIYINDSRLHGVNVLNMLADPTTTTSSRSAS